MARFLVSPENLLNDHFRLTGSEAHHALAVLRKKVGDSIELFDGRDRALLGRITHVDGQEIAGVILEQRIVADASRTPVWLMAGLIKGPRWDWLVQKACEVGADVLWPVSTERTVVDLAGKDTSAKTDRWQRIATEAAKQCGRIHPLEIRPVQTYEQALKNLPHPCQLVIPWEKENARALRQAIDPIREGPIVLCIGPEGGWTVEEVHAAEQAGAVAVTLGRRLLRSETAAIVAVALVQDLLEYRHS